MELDTADWLAVAKPRVARIAASTHADATSSPLRISKKR